MRSFENTFLASNIETGVDDLIAAHTRPVWGREQAGYRTNHQRLPIPLIQEPRQRIEFVQLPLKLYINPKTYVLK